MTATSFAARVGVVEMRQSGRSEPANIFKCPDLLPEGAAPRGVELERGRIGGKPLLQPAGAVAGGAREILHPDGGHRGSGLGDVRVGQARGERGLHMHGAGDLEGRAEA